MPELSLSLRKIACHPNCQRFRQRLPEWPRCATFVGLSSKFLSGTFTKDIIDEPLSMLEAALAYWIVGHCRISSVLRHLSENPPAGASRRWTAPPMAVISIPLDLCSSPRPLGGWGGRASAPRDLRHVGGRAGVSRSHGHLSADEVSQADREAQTLRENAGP